MASRGEVNGLLFFMALVAVVSVVSALAKSSKPSPTPRGTRRRRRGRGLLEAVVDPEPHSDSPVFDLVDTLDRPTGDVARLGLTFNIFLELLKASNLNLKAVDPAQRDGGIIVLAPHDGAFQNWSLLEHLSSPRNRASLNTFVRFHVLRKPSPAALEKFRSSSSGSVQFDTLANLPVTISKDAGSDALTISGGIDAPTDVIDTMRFNRGAVFAIDGPLVQSGISIDTNDYSD